ncbi:Uncharacterised protein [uncultured archaeon]|nr:Uncharacterised protein [uncultured archaeon]
MFPWFGFTHKENLSTLETIFNKTMSFQKDASLIVFDNKYSFLPRLYPANTPVFINGSGNEMFKVVTSDNFTLINKVLFLSSQINETQQDFSEKYKVQSNSSPAITFQKINPTKYEVKIENATSPFFLVFSESYHPRWTVYLENEPLMFNDVIAEYKDINVKEVRHSSDFVIGDVSYLLKKPAISQDRHFQVNGYANGWYIEKPGTYYITLYYWPQLLFYAGFIVSWSALFVCAGYLVLSRVIRKDA